MEKRKTFHGRQVGKKRLLPIVFPLFLFLLIPLNGYGDDTPMPEVVQQNSTRITGVVKDAYGEPVIGANVKVVGTTQGTITDFEGKFSINVSGASAKIKISFIGYKDKEVTAKKGVSLNIVLEEDAQTLGEVQVVAYGVQKKVSITGAISSMKGDDLLKTPAGSLSNVLSGQITGISSVQYSGEPGADAADIYVRGVATWNNAKPLIQVDGVERDFSQIDPNEIESVTVLKDASATAVFGVRGANGVILITTKRGAEGKAKVSFSTSAGVNVRTKDLEFANSYQYASYYNIKKNICKIASKGTTEMLIENTRARFGDYTFYLQTFNAAHEAGAVQELKARSGAMPASYTEKSRTQVSLIVDQLSCNYPDASEGYFDRLIDGKTADPSFFHTNWHSPQVDLPHYIQIDLKEEHENFAFEYYTRDTGNTDGFPTSAELQISTDGEHWETVSTLSGLPTTRQTKYASDFVMPGKKFKYFRFNVLTSSLNKKYFHIGEIAFFDADIEKYDPETVPLD